MKKTLKILLILVIGLLLFTNISVFATNTTNDNDTSLSNSSQSTNSNDTTVQSGTQSNANNSQTSTIVSSVDSIDEGELSTPEIINIILIATSIVIILLAIAILIKLH